MNTGNTGGGMYSWVCQGCGAVVPGGQGHVCGVYPSFPFPAQQQPTASPCRAPWMPLTIEDIRKVISEELDKRLPSSVQPQSGDEAVK